MKDIVAYNTDDLEHVLSDCLCTGKRCTNCQEVYCRGLFSRDKKRSDGLQCHCKKCNKIYREDHAAQRKAYHDVYSKLYYQANIERISARHRAYNKLHLDEHNKRVKKHVLAHHERVRANGRAWYQRNADKRRADRIAYRQSHLELEKERDRLYHQRYPEKSRIKSSVRSTRKTQAGGSYTLQEWLELKAMYGCKCLWCGRREPDIKLTADHIIPVVKGGTSNIDNIQPLCQSCNSRKRIRILDFRDTSIEMI